MRQNNLPDVKYKAFNTHSLTQQHIAVTPTTSHTMKNHFMFSYYIQVNIQFFSIAFKNFQNLKLPFNLMTHYLQFLNYVMLFLFFFTVAFAVYFVGKTLKNSLPV